MIHFAILHLLPGYFMTAFIVVPPAHQTVSPVHRPNRCCPAFPGWDTCTGTGSTHHTSSPGHPPCPPALPASSWLPAKALYPGSPEHRRGILYISQPHSPFPCPPKHQAARSFSRLLKAEVFRKTVHNRRPIKKEILTELKKKSISFF